MPNILEHYHKGKNNLHRGINLTIRRIKEQYNWTSLTRNVEQFIEACDIFQKQKYVDKNLAHQK